MKKSLLFLIAIYLLITLTGCGNNPGSANTGTDSTPANTSGTTDTSDATDNFIPVTSEIAELESGFSAVSYAGDYGFDLFLEQGGAESDQAVLQFLNSNVFHGNSELRMGGDAFGCSTISVKNLDGGRFFGRNFDWQACDAMVVTAYPKEGYASISTVNLGFIRQGAGVAAGMLTRETLTIAALYAPLDGMNEKGLCVSVNMIQDGATIHQNTGKPDITTTTAIRLMLDKAASVEEALNLLRSYDLHASLNYMIHFAIADSEGGSVAVEYVGNEMIVTETPILTNFYLAEGEKHGVGTAQSHTRFEILERTLEENSAMTAPQVRDALDSVSKGNFGEFESTEWSVVFDQSALTATYYHRENYEVGYSFRIENETNETSKSDVPVNSNNSASSDNRAETPEQNTGKPNQTEQTSEIETSIPSETEPSQDQTQPTESQSEISPEPQPEDPPESQPEPPITEEEPNMLKIEILVGNETFSATLYDNEAARTLIDILPLTLNMSELNGNEKYYYLDTSLPTNASRPSGIKTGDIMLYGNSCLVLFYESFSTSYSYTPIGHIDDPTGLAAALGSGSVQVTFRKG